jgi:hypothetical protein
LVPAVRASQFPRHCPVIALALELPRNLDSCYFLATRRTARVVPTCSQRSAVFLQTLRASRTRQSASSGAGRPHTSHRLRRYFVDSPALRPAAPSVPRCLDHLAGRSPRSCPGSIRAGGPARLSWCSSPGLPDRRCGDTFPVGDGAALVDFASLAAATKAAARMPTQHLQSPTRAQCRTSGAFRASASMTQRVRLRSSGV